MQRIRYYYAPDGAAYYLEPNVFFPIEQTLQFRPMDGVGELCTSARTNYNGPPPAGIEADFADGTLEDFQGLTPYTGPLPIELVPDCRVPKLIAFGAFLSNYSFHHLQKSSAIDLGALRDIGRRPAIRFVVPPAVPVFSFGGSVAFAGFVPGVAKFSGPAFGVAIKDLRLQEAFIAFTHEAKMDWSDTGKGKAAFHGYKVDAPREGKTAFFASMTNYSFTAGSVTPGSVCTAAPTLAFDTDYTFTVASGANNWFTFAVAAGTQYYVKITVSSGTYPGTAISTGANCSALTNEFADSSITPCQTFTKGAATNCFILVGGTLFGSSTYTVRVGTGSCPP